MPTYEYVCRSCGNEFEVFQSMRDAPVKTCPKCGKATVKRLIGRGAGIIFKGSGFYETDYKRASAPTEGGKPAAESSGGEKKEGAAPSTPAAPPSGGAAGTPPPKPKES